mmetsp:Transcript_16945/g.25075  ORF Transcript_16945/g.25075 Transcript_16945/m.25075 type:complete len:368 (+) Transcript_16945:86-1189(+)
MTTNCETSESTSSPAVGIILVLIACLCYSFGNNLQRYSLLRQPGERVFGCLNRNLGWLLGALIYFSANGIYSVALSFAPVSLLSAVFSLTILTNAACAVYFLGDRVPLLAYPGYFFVLLGAIVFAVAFRAEVCHFDGSELIAVMTTPQALVYWVVMILVIISGGFFARNFEKKYPLAKDTPTQIIDEEIMDAEDSNQEENQEIMNDQALALNENQDAGEKPDDEDPAPPSTAGNLVQSDTSGKELQNNEHDIPPKTLLAARLIYPTSLGAIETVGLLILKAFNSLLTSAATGDEVDGKVADQDFPNDIGLWIVLVILGILFFLLIVLFLRLTYSRFEITGAFPVEFGMLTFASVLGGFAVFQDYNLG